MPRSSQPGSSNFRVLKGVFQIPYKRKSDKSTQEDDSDDSDAEEDSDPWQDFHHMGSEEGWVKSRVLKMKRVEIRDDAGETNVCNGKFPLTHVFWLVTVKVNKTYLKSAPSYAIRLDEENVRRQNLVTIFLSACFAVSDKISDDDASGTKACFETFCRTTGVDNTLSFTVLEETLRQYMKSERSKGCCLARGPHLGQFTCKNHSDVIDQHVFQSELGLTVLAAASHPDLVKTLSVLLPTSFMQFIHKLCMYGKSAGGDNENDQEDNENAATGEEDRMSNVDMKISLHFANKMARESPWEFAFKDIIFDKFGIYGTEATLSAYDSADYFARTPQTQADAIYIYEVLKKSSSVDGHMYVEFWKLQRSYFLKKLSYRIDGEARWKNALDYLEDNHVIKRERFKQDVNIFLSYNWNAEVDVTHAVSQVLERHKEEALCWNVEIEDPDFASLREDPDQLRALHLIRGSPITVLSGKGGCGKTTVVTKLLKHLCGQEKQRIKAMEESDEEVLALTCSLEKTVSPETENKTNLPSPQTSNINEAIGLDMQAQNTADVSQKIRTHAQGPLSPWSSRGAENVQENSPKSDRQTSAVDVSTTKGQRVLSASGTKESKVVRSQQQVVAELVKLLDQSTDSDDPQLVEFKQTMLLTAPTGKAARLLGCKSKLPSATLHSVIMSWKMYCRKKAELEESPWKYAKVQVLVVDECSLVSVRLFATVMNLLTKHSDLRKIILLGDVRQLPSIEAGNFLTDMFGSLASDVRNGVNRSIELTTNHRSESRLIVENAGKISQRIMPTFDDDQRFRLIMVSDDVDRDVAIRKLISTTEDLMSEVNSQFVSFRNAHCLAVNEICCQVYNRHSIMERRGKSKKERANFQIGDKICIGKNGFVSNCYERLVERYQIDYPEFQKVWQKAKQRVCPGKTTVGGEQNKGEENLQLYRTDGNRSVLDSTSVMGLMLEDNKKFDETLKGMQERDQKLKQERAERLRRAAQKQEEWKAKKAAEERLAALFGDGRLCNGEVFFIMDEFDVFEKNKRGVERPVRHLVLSDRDPVGPRVVCVPFRVLKTDCKIKHSWARTIHTYQGSESDTVVYVLGPAIPQTWQHVYTAITRGKKSVYIIGCWEQLQIAVKRRGYPRNSRLEHRMQEMLKNYQESADSPDKLHSTPQTEDFMFDSNDSWLNQLDLTEAAEEMSKESGAAVSKENIDEDMEALLGMKDDVNDYLDDDEDEETQRPEDDVIGDISDVSEITWGIENPDFSGGVTDDVSVVLTDSEDSVDQVTASISQANSSGKPNFTAIKSSELRNCPVENQSSSTTTLPDEDGGDETIDDSSSEAEESIFARVTKSKNSFRTVLTKDTVVQVGAFISKPSLLQCNDQVSMPVASVDVQVADPSCLSITDEPAPVSVSDSTDISHVSSTNWLSMPATPPRGSHRQIPHGETVTPPQRRLKSEPCTPSSNMSPVDCAELTNATGPLSHQTPKKRHVEDLVDTPLRDHFTESLSLNMQSENSDNEENLELPLKRKQVRKKLNV